MAEFETDYLAHHGIKGQKWGVRRSPEQLGHAPKETKKPKTEAIQKMLEKKRKEKAEKNKEKKAANDAKLKEHLRKHPREIYKHRDKLSKSDVDELMREIEWDRKCKDIQATEWQRTLRKVQNVTSTIQTVSNLINTGVNAYNNTALVYNAVYDYIDHEGGDVSHMKKKPRVAWAKAGSGGALYDTEADNDIN